MSSNNGYWIKNKLIVDVSNSTHINYIMDYPEDFNLTKDYISSLYKKYNEKIGTEGKAREEIIRKVSELGWIRVRHYVINHEEYWSLQFDVYNERNRKTIRNFIEWALYESKVMNKNDSLKFSGYKDDYYSEYNFMNGGVLKYLSENKNILLDKSFTLVYYIR